MNTLFTCFDKAFFPSLFGLSSVSDQSLETVSKLRALSSNPEAVQVISSWSQGLKATDHESLLLDKYSSYPLFLSSSFHCKF